MKDIYIIGAGGFGREVAWVIERINEINPIWNIAGFIDDNEAIWIEYRDGYKVLGGCEYLKSVGETYAVCAVGSGRIRKMIVQKLADSKVKFPTIIDPSVIFSNNIEFGEGTIICAGTILTVDIKVGKHVIINLDCTIGHDAVIEDYVTLYPGVHISGNVLLGEASEIGTGTQIIQGKSVVPDTIIGAGAVVIKDCIESGTYVGCPVKKIK